MSTESAKFTLTSDSSEYVLADATGKNVTVSSCYNPTSETYTISIVRDPAASQLPYSLYNLVIQNRVWTTYLKPTNAAQNVVFLDNAGNPIAVDPATGEYTIPYTGTVSPKDPAPSAAGICYVKFSGTQCDLTGRSDRKMDGPPMPPTPGGTMDDGDDNSPPPPDTGGGE